MSHISIKNVYAKNTPRRPEYNKNHPFIFSLVWVDGDLDIDFLSIDNLCRREDVSDIETLKVCKNAHIKNLSLSNIYHDNITGAPITLFTNEGVIDKLFMYNTDAGKDMLLDNKGTIGAIKQVLL